MTKQEENDERRYWYEERLGILGYIDTDFPTQQHHNPAVAEAGAHIEGLKIQERKEGISELTALRDSL
jgi:hypothetical protein